MAEVTALRAEVERLQDLVQNEVRLRGSREQELQDARLHIAALEHRVLDTRQTFAELEGTLLHDLQIQKRANLSELEVTRFLTTFRNAFHRQVDLDEASVHSHRAAVARLAALQEKVDRLERAAEHERAASEQCHQEWRQQKAALQEAHAKAMENLEAELRVARRQLHGRSRQRLGDACQLIRDRASLVRDSMLDMRVMVEEFRRIVVEGVPQGASRRTIAVMSSSNAVGRFKRAALLGVSGDRAKRTVPSSTALFASGGTSEEADSNNHSDHTNAAAPLLAAAPSAIGGGLVGKMMKALESTKAEHEFLVQRERELYECLRQLSECMCSVVPSNVDPAEPGMVAAKADDRELGSNAPVDLSTLLLPDHSHSRDVDVRHVGSALVSLVERRNLAWLTEKANLVVQLRDAEYTSVTLKEAHAALAKRLSVYEDSGNRSEAQTQTEGFFRADGSASAESHHALSVGVQCSLGSLRGGTSSGSALGGKARGQSKYGFSGSRSAAQTNRADGVNDSTSEDAVAPVELPLWTEAGMLSAAETAHRRSVTKRCMIRWLRRFERRKRSSLEDFLKNRVAPALGMSSSVFRRRPCSSSPRRWMGENEGSAAVSSAGEQRRPSVEPNVMVTSFPKPSAVATPRPPSAPRGGSVSNAAAAGSHSVRNIRGERERSVTTLSYRSISADPSGQ